MSVYCFLIVEFFEIFEPFLHQGRYKAFEEICLKNGDYRNSLEIGKSLMTPLVNFGQEWCLLCFPSENYSSICNKLTDSVLPHSLLGELNCP